MDVENWVSDRDSLIFFMVFQRACMTAEHVLLCARLLWHLWHRQTWNWGQVQGLHIRGPSSLFFFSCFFISQEHYDPLGTSSFFVCLVVCLGLFGWFGLLSSGSFRRPVLHRTGPRILPAQWSTTKTRSKSRSSEMRSTKRWMWYGYKRFLVIRLVKWNMVAFWKLPALAFISLILQFIDCFSSVDFFESISSFFFGFLEFLGFWCCSCSTPSGQFLFFAILVLCSFLEPTRCGQARWRWRTPRRGSWISSAMADGETWWRLDLWMVGADGEGWWIFLSQLRELLVSQPKSI